MRQSIKLNTSAILHVPLDKYDKDFTFIVNGKSFRTSKFVADLLSSKISKYHSVDPMINEIIINTENRGNFENFLKLQNFEEIQQSKEENKFIFEVIKQLETPIKDMNEKRSEITIDNVIDRLIRDEIFQEIYPKHYEEEVNFISINFSEVLKNQREKLMKLSLITIESIINNNNLQLETEDELLKFINDLYNESHEYSILYSYVYFENVNISSIEEFVNIFDINDLNKSTWESISTRLKKEINNNYKLMNENNNNKRYKFEKINRIEYKTDNDFEGIFKFLRNNFNIKEEIKVTASSVESGILDLIIQSDFPNNEFHTKNAFNSWVCIEFIKRKIIPKHYTIRSNNWESTAASHPRNWNFEGSVDSKKWEKLDSQKECSYLRGENLVHTFSIQNNKQPFKYFRIYQTGKSWANNYYLCFNCIEIYGEFVSV